MIKRLNPNHLKRLLNNNCDILLYQEGLSEEGEPLSFLELKNQKCRFVEKTRTVITKDGKKVRLIGKVILAGDISVIPERNFVVDEINNMSVEELNSKKVKLKTDVSKLNRISDGVVRIYDSEYRIYQANKPRNPDGTVHHTTLELM